MEQKEKLTIESSKGSQSKPQNELFNRLRKSKVARAAAIVGAVAVYAAGAVAFTKEHNRLHPVPEGVVVGKVHQDAENNVKESAGDNIAAGLALGLGPIPVPAVESEVVKDDEDWILELRKCEDSPEGACVETLAHVDPQTYKEYEINDYYKGQTRLELYDQEP